jgi:hypothetical protein
MNPESTPRSIFSSLSQSTKLSSYVLAAHLVVHRLRYRFYGGGVGDLIHNQAPNDLDVSVPKEVSLVTAVEQLKNLLVQSSFQFDRTESKGPYVVRVYFMSHIFNDEIIIELVHTHHWTDRDGCQVDADINNLCVYVLDGLLARATLEIRIPNQPIGATLASIVENILAKQFVLVKRSEERIEKLTSRGYVPISRQRPRL